MRAEQKEEQSIVLIGKNEVYGDIRHEGKHVIIFYLDSIFTGICSFKPRDHYVAPVHMKPCMCRNKKKGDEDGNIFCPIVLLEALMKILHLNEGFTENLVLFLSL